MLFQTNKQIFSPFLKKPYLYQEEKIFQKQDLCYLPHLAFESFYLYRKTLLKIKKNLRLEIIPMSKRYFGSRYREQILSQVGARVKLKWINDEIGFGIFADENLSLNAFVGEFTGIVKKRSSKVLKDNLYCLAYPINPLKRTYVIDASKYGNMMRYINHSYSPNLDLHSVIVNGHLHMILVANKDINYSEQLTFDYGELYWSDFSNPPKRI